MTRNPFEVFGLSPELVAELSEKELFGVLKAMYRTLHKTFHPDIAGRKSTPENNTRAVELNLAFEDLNLEQNPASFRKLRKAFVARRPASAYRRSLILESQLVAQQAHESQLADVFLNYLAQSTPWGAEMNADNTSHEIFLPAKNIRIGLLDVAINHNLTQASWLLGSNYKQIEINTEGQMSVKPVGRRRYSRSNYIHLLGCVPISTLDIIPHLERTASDFYKSPALNASIGANGPKLSVLNLINRDNFKRQILPLLRPVLMERSYLFSLNRTEFCTSGFINLEGLVVKLDNFINHQENP